MVTATGPAATTLDLLGMLFRDEFARTFDVELWDGTYVPAREERRFVLRVLAPFALRAALSPPLDLNPHRAFVDQFIDMTGDLEAAVDAFERAARALPKTAFPKLGRRPYRRGARRGCAAGCTRAPATPRQSASTTINRLHSTRRSSIRTSSTRVPISMTTR
jgi:hypothetical protein